MENKEFESYDRALFKEPAEPKGDKAIDVQEKLYEKVNTMKLSSSDKRAERLANAKEKILEKIEGNPRKSAKDWIRAQKINNGR